MRLLFSVKRNWPYYEVWGNYFHESHQVARFFRRRTAEEVSASLTTFVEGLPAAQDREAAEAKMFAEMMSRPMLTCTADCALNCTHSGVHLIRPHVVTAGTAAPAPVPGPAP